jgi:environmental stress-induced protein Ves
MVLPRLLKAADYRRMPWRNGAGSTTELVVSPELVALGSGERFLFRVSIADVGSDGPFSRFDGYDRHIMLLSGAGMVVDCGAHGAIDLTKPREPRSFSGDWNVVGRLVDGPVRDFNLMVDRSRASSTLEVTSFEAPMDVSWSLGTTCVVYVLEGRLRNGEPGDTLVATEPFTLAPAGRVCVATCRIVETRA